MSRRIVWVLFLFASFVLASDYMAPVVRPLPEAIVMARLAEISWVRDSSQSAVYICKYRVERVLQGSGFGKELFVGHFNPWLSRNQIPDTMAYWVSGSIAKLRTGELHKLSLVRPISQFWRGLVVDDFFDDTTERWFVLSTEPGL